MSGLPVIRERYRPHTMRVSAISVVYLLVPVALAVAMIAGVHGIFAGAQPRVRRQAGPTASFVRLSEEQSAAAMARVRTSWQLERGGLVSVEFDPADAAFESAVRPVEAITVRRPAMPPAYMSMEFAVPVGDSLVPASKAAPEPAELDADYAPLSTEALFPRMELLKFDGLSPFKKGTRR